MSPMPTISEHRLWPDVTLDEHFRRTQIAFGEALSTKRAIYLDTKYWIILRLAAEDARSASDTKLLKLLRGGVAAGLLFCPISESTFLELMKQSSSATRLATAAMIDELSLGATLIDSEARIATEIAHLMYSKSGQADLHPLKHLVWRKLSYVLGLLHPTIETLDRATEVAVQKAYFDHRWGMSLRDMIALLGPRTPAGSDLTSTAAKLNCGVSAHADDLRSFEQAYSAEVRGIIDITGHHTVEVLKAMAQRAGVTLDGPSAEGRWIIENQCKNLFAIALERGLARDALRTMHVLASLHASLRWNKGRKFKSNDLFDFDHAAAALPYCDVFLTERSLRTMVKQEHVALDKLYGCRVVAEVDEAVMCVSEILGWDTDGVAHPVTQ